MRLSQMAQGLIGSEIIKLATEIKARIKAGEPIYNLTIGDFDPEIFPIPDELREEIARAYAEGQTNYPNANGLPELRRAIRNFTQRRLGLSYSEEDILVSSGARPMIFAAYTAVVDPDDTVVFPVPSWNNNHYSHITAANAVLLQTRPEDNFMPTADLLRPHIQNARLIALCSPLNPTGTLFSEEQLRGICELVLAENETRGDSKRPLYVLYDQIYSNLVYGDNEHLTPVGLFPEMRNYTLFVDGMSKAFCATGLRVGWGFGPDDVIQKMRSILSHVGAWAPRAEQMATARYLDRVEVSSAFLDQTCQAISERLEACYEGFQRLKAAGYPVDAIAPQGALYLTVKIDLVGYKRPDGSVVEDHAQTHRIILDDAQVALVPFPAFGAANSPWYRLSVGTLRVEHIDDLFQRLEKTMKSLEAKAGSAVGSA